MKAKEYAKDLKENNYDLDSVDRTIKSLLDEILSISKTRRVGSTQGLKGVLQEIKQKWIAISNRSEGCLRKDGFDNYLINRKFLNKDGSLNENPFREFLDG